MKIYLPMTAEILTVGHLRVIKKCSKMGKLYLGLLTEKALKGYKKVVVPYEQRKEILESIKGNHIVVPQNNLNFYENLIKYKIDIVVSGDGWEREELEAIEKANCKPFTIRLRGEKKKKYSVSKIKQKICKVKIHI